MSKVVLVDTSSIFVPTVKVWGRLNERNIVEHRQDFILPSICMYLNSLFSTLAKIGLNQDDLVLMVEEGHSWRKNYASFYKAHRDNERANDYYVDWPEQYRLFKKCHERLKEATNWKFVREPSLCESDDIIAIACRLFSDKEIIIATADKDLFQLAYYSNVKLFNLNKKFNGSNGIYELVKNPLKIIQEKVRLGDRSDNILVDKTADDITMQELREFLINLLDLPPEVEEKGKKAILEAIKIQNIPNIDRLPYFNQDITIRQRYDWIYKKNKMITFEQCMEEINIKKEKQNARQKNRKMVSIKQKATTH